MRFSCFYSGRTPPPGPWRRSWVTPSLTRRLCRKHVGRLMDLTLTAELPGEELMDQQYGGWEPLIVPLPG
ncbi:hypothetical protein NHX12_022983, partial [Muraenolepis orangiensis]